MNKIALNRSYSGQNSILKKFVPRHIDKNKQRKQNIIINSQKQNKKVWQIKKQNDNKPNPDILLDPEGYYMLKKNPLHLDRSILNVTICNKKTQFSQIMDHNNLSNLDINCSGIENLKQLQTQKAKNSKKQYLLQSLLFDDEQQNLINGIQHQSETNNIEKKCLCGCLDIMTRKSISRLKYKNNALKKKWNRYYSQIIFEYFFKQKYEYTFEQIKQKMRRFFLNNNLIFRLQQIEQSLEQLFNMPKNQFNYIINSKKIICYRKFGIYLEEFTQSNQNQIFKCINNLTKKYKEKYISFNQLKMEILHNTSRNFYQKFKKSIQNLKLYLSGLINIQQQFCYWDLYRIKNTQQCNNFVKLLNQYEQILRQETNSNIPSVDLDRVFNLIDSINLI